MYLMAARASRILVCAIILYATTLNPIGCHGYQPKPQEKEHKLLIVFGDSLFDPGNNKYLHNTSPSVATSWPYGMSLHNKSTGRFSDGLVVPDFIALFANLKVIPPYLKPDADLTDGASFASAGGAVLGDSTRAMNLRTQLDKFHEMANSLADKVGKQEAKKILMRSVYLLSLGGNDYFRFNTRDPDSTQSERIEYMRMVVGNLTNGFKEIYARGGRKFGIQNVGPIGCMPSIKSSYPELNGSCAKNFLIHAKLHNKALSNSLKKLSEHLPGFKYSIMDYFDALGDRINNAPKYGFEDGIAACCGSGPYNGKNCGGGSDGTLPFTVCKNPNAYVFFDGSHTTHHTNYQLAKLLWSGPPKVTGPYNVKQLFEFA